MLTKPQFDRVGNNCIILHLLKLSIFIIEMWSNKQRSSRTLSIELLKIFANITLRGNQLELYSNNLDLRKLFWTQLVILLKEFACLHLQLLGVRHFISPIDIYCVVIEINLSSIISNLSLAKLLHLFVIKGLHWLLCLVFWLFP